MYHTRPNNGYGPPHGGKGAPDVMSGPPVPLGPGPGVPAYEPDFTIKTDVTDFEKENDYIQFFKHIQGHHSCTHSSMIGPSDHRIPRSGKFDVTKKDALEKL